MAVVIAAWVSAALVSLGIVRMTDAGPVVLRLSDDHGVHALDAAGAVASGAVAAAVTVAAKRAARRRAV